MKKFNNVKVYNEYLENEFGFGLDEFGFEDFEKFVNGNEFVVYFDEDEDFIIEICNKKYYIVENVMGIKFVEM